MYGVTAKKARKLCTLVSNPFFKYLRFVRTFRNYLNIFVLFYSRTKLCTQCKPKLLHKGTFEDQ